MSRPYLIIPQFIEQPTWGGDYILKLKDWDGAQSQSMGKIGQSHELSSTSLLAISVKNSVELQPLINNGGDKQSMLVSELEPINLLIKLNQARGNSFQLHINPHTKGTKWKPKPESWYFLENGSITLGVAPGADMSQYKNICVEIDTFMNSLSRQVMHGELSLEQARLKASDFVQVKNPWQFVNKHMVNKHDLIDLSMGAIHHSWEEDMENAPLGNVVFEVQIEASDDEATIRSFDQGKIKDDGSVRKLTIDDYFIHLDSDPTHNDISYLKRSREKNNLLSTDYYAVDIIEPKEKLIIQTEGKYHHLYVRDGSVSIVGGGIVVMVRKGHSCFIPSSLAQYTVEKIEPNSVVLKTYSVNT